MKLATMSIASLLLLAAGDLAQAQTKAPQEQSPIVVAGRSTFQHRSLDLDQQSASGQQTGKKAKSKKAKKKKSSQ